MVSRLLVAFAVSFAIPSSLQPRTTRRSRTRKKSQQHGNIGLQTGKDGANATNVATAPRLPAALRTLDASLRNAGTRVADSQDTETPSQDAVDMEMASGEQVQENNQHLEQLENMKAQLEALGLPASSALD